MTPSGLHPERVRSFLVARLLVFLSAICLGCLEDKPTVPCEEYTIGVLEGYVLSGGEPYPARVSLSRGGRSTIDSLTDSLGWYRLELPVGMYSLYLDRMYQDSVNIYPMVRRLDLVRGRVVVRIATNAALEGQAAEVSLHSASGWLSPFSYYKNVTAQNGVMEVIFPLVRPDRYRILISCGTWGTMWFLPGTLDVLAADVVTAPADRTVRVHGALDRVATLSGDLGSCSARWQHSHSYVSAIGADFKEVAHTYPSDDGRFELHLLDAQPVRIRLRPDPEQWIGGRTYQDATVFSPDPGQRLDGIRGGLGNIRVILQGPSNYTGHDGIITVVDEVGRPIGTVVTRTNSTICALTPGRYRLHISGLCKAQPWLSQWFDGAITQEEATWLEVRDGETTDVSFRLTAGGSIRGRIVNASSSRTIQMRICDSAGISLCENWSDFDRGVFVFNGLEDGAYYLAVRLQDAATDTWWYPGTAAFDSARAVSVVDHQIVTGIQWSLPGE